MSDTISRQAAISHVDDVPYIKDHPNVGLLWKAWIESLPSAQQWIPVTERLPENYTDVLVWFEYYRYGDYNRLYQMHGIGTYIKEYDSWIINHETGWRKLRVFAWMPLPEPWEGEEHGASRTMLPKKSLC